MQWEGLMHGVVISNPEGSDFKQAILHEAGMTFVPGKGWCWFPNAKRFADLSWTDIEKWMRQKESRERKRGGVWTVEGFRARLKMEKQAYAQLKAAGAIGWVATEIMWPPGLCEALEHDYPVEFRTDYASSRNTITANFERTLGPLVICGRYRQMQVTT